jgi:shikimate kinase
MPYFPVDLARSIILIGFMGAGKSSVGRCLQRRVGLARIDTDELLAAKFGMKISAIFATHGESRFREAETEVLRELALDRPAIIVTGGGIVLKQQNVDLLKRLGTIVWLDGDEEILFERASRKNDRPLLQTENPRASFSALFATRRPIYSKAADIRIDTANLSHDEVADIILSNIDNLMATRK